MTKRFATVVGLLVAPLVAAIALVVLGATRSNQILWDNSAFGWVAVYYCYTVGAALMFGLPMYWVLSRYNKITWWSATVAGLLSGAAMNSIFFPLMDLVVVMIGGISGLSFWAVWRLGRVDVR